MKRELANLALLFLATFVVSGCLVTRNQVRESVRRDPVTPEQQQKANNEVRYQELDQQTRELMGRIETLENSVNLINADRSGARLEQANDKKYHDEKLKIYEEAITKLESQYLALAQKMEAMQLAQTQASTKSVSANKEAKATGAGLSTYDAAEADYSKKRWKEAIVGFEKYRSTNPKGKRYSEATYKIGAAFHELGMKAEARAFYSEVVEKFPKTDWAQKSSQRLKTLK